MVQSFDTAWLVTHAKDITSDPAIAQLVVVGQEFEPESTSPNDTARSYQQRCCESAGGPRRVTGCSLAPNSFFPAALRSDLRRGRLRGTPWATSARMQFVTATGKKTYEFYVRDCQENRTR